MIDLANLAMPIKEAACSKSPKVAVSSEGVTSDGPLKSSATKPRPIDVKDALLKGLPPMGDGDELMLEVTCGQNQACLYMSRLQLGSKGTCVLFENSWLTPNEFQYISGRETAKDWKRSIKHHGKSLKVLIAKGILTTSPLQCSCGQCSSPSSQMKDKYSNNGGVGGESKMPNAPVHDVYVAADGSKLKPENDYVPLVKTVGKNLTDARYFRLPAESDVVLHSALIESPAKACAQPDPLVPSRSQDGARYLSSCDHMTTDKGPFGAFLDFNSMGEKQQQGADRMDGCLPVGASHQQQNLTNDLQEGRKIDGHESQKTPSVAAETRVKAKRKLEGSEAEQHGQLKEQKTCQPSGECRRTNMEYLKSDVAELPTQPSSATPKKPCHSADKPIAGKTPVDSSHWNSSNHLTAQLGQPYHSESNSCKTSIQEKNAKKLATSQTNCQSNSSASSGKHLNPCMGGSVNQSDPSHLVSESSFLFPSFGTPYYPMITAPQLSTYYPNPYVWPFPAGSPSSCSYGWAPTAAEMVAPSCLRSPSKDSLDCSQTSRIAGNGSDAVFNFPWMKRTNISSSSAENQLARESGDAIPSGKRKHDDLSTDYLMPSKHPYLLSPESPRHLFGESMTTAWPAYNQAAAAAAAALDFRFLPYSLPSYVPDGRGVFASNFLKGNENTTNGLGLYRGFFPTQCLGVNSR